MFENENQQPGIEHLKRSIKDVESVVHKREPEVQAAYAKTFEKNIDAVTGLIENYISKSHSIDAELITHVVQYLFRISFISALSRVTGEKKEMKETAMAATLLVVDAGFPLRDARNLIVVFENEHAIILKNELPVNMLAGGRAKLFGFAAVVAILLVTVWVIIS